ncbi:MAG: cyclic pyranopterin monophosphate synthase MoaC [Clostridiales bacterium]|nr:cyclic pyranopterin monophosphate synthase MoaC [Clostridiales bacterium]
MNFSHLDGEGNALMVDVTQKAETERMAVASGRIRMSEECFALLEAGNMKKGDVLGVAQVAGIMATKETARLIPLCHSLGLTGSTLTFTLLPESCEVEARCTATCHGKTGVEMETMTGVSVALLTVYDMCKAVDKRMVIGDIHLVEKKGGKSGHFYFEEDLA